MNFYYGGQYCDEIIDESTIQRNANATMQIDEVQPVLIYPNPANQMVTISLMPTLLKDNTILNIYDTSGRIVFTQKVNSQMPLLNLDISNWTEGVFLYQIINENKPLQSGNFNVAR